jgi:hypothetical protein
MTLSSDMASGGDSIGEVQGPTLQGENPRSGLNWLCLAISLLKVLLCGRGLFSRMKPKIYNRAITVLVHCSLLGGIAFWRCWTFGVVLVVLVLLLQGIYHCSGAFSFSVILLLFLLCASVLPLGHCVVAETGCNWYRLDINIYSLSKK